MAMKLLTADEFGRIPSGLESCRHELVRGSVISLPFRTWQCAEITVNIAFAIKAWLRVNPIGEVAIGAGVIVERNPDTVRAPDVGFVGRERIPTGDRMNRYLDGAPDLCVEVLSPSNTRSKIREKLGEYFSGGAKLVWVVDPDDRSVTIYEKAEEGRMLHQGTALDGGSVLPGFTCPVADFFK